MKLFSAAERVTPSLLGSLLAGMLLVSGCGPAHFADSEDTSSQDFGTVQQGLYNAYPAGMPTYTATTADAGWGMYFDNYADETLIECSSDMTTRSGLDVTSGCLRAKWLNSGTYRRGWTDTFNFRIIARKLNASGQLAKWTDITFSARLNIATMQPTTTSYDGLNLFARYQTEDDLYVVGVRRDGSIIMQRKLGGLYSNLIPTTSRWTKGAGGLVVGTWYTLKVTVFGSTIKFYIDGVLQATGTDSQIGWGTVGVRTDYNTVYMDDLVAE